MSLRKVRIEKKNSSGKIMLQFTCHMHWCNFIRIINGGHVLDEWKYGDNIKRWMKITNKSSSSAVYILLSHQPTSENH